MAFESVGYIHSTRRQQMTSNIANKDLSEVILEHGDFVSTKKFFDCFLEKESVKKFIEMRNNHQSSNDALYLLWNLCIDNIDLLESEALRKNNTTSEDLSQHDVMEKSMSDYIFEGTTSVTDQTNLVILKPEDSMEVVQKDENQSIINILNIPVINACDISALEEISVIVDPSQSNANIDQSNGIALTGTSIEESCNINFTNVIDTSIDATTSETNETHTVHKAKSTYLHTKEKELTENCKNDPIPSSPNLVKESIPLENCKNDTGPNSTNLAKESILSELNHNYSSNSILDAKRELKSSSDIWEKHLLWPSMPVIKGKIEKKTEQLPCVLTCSKWREYQFQKKEEKKKELETREKILQRKIKKEKAEKEKQKRREERDLKKPERIRIEKEKIKIKKEKSEKRAAEKATNLKRKSNLTIKNELKKRRSLQSLDTNIQGKNVALDLTLSK